MNDVKWIQSPAGCNYLGYEFGAGYPDSVCREGRLHDADDCDNEGNIYEQEEDIPCPMCRPEEAITWWAARRFCHSIDHELDPEGLRKARELVADIRRNRGVDTPTSSPTPATDAGATNDTPPRNTTEATRP